MQAFQDIFISYGRRDSLTFASRLNRRLVDGGFTVWFDYEDIPLGVDYQKQIDDGIERSDNFLFIISPQSINSPYCALELELALKYNKRIIPWLHVERISYEIWQDNNPQGTAEEWENYQAKGLHDHFQNMHPVLRKINWIYGREGQDDLAKAFTGLLNICDRHKDYVHHHTVLLVKALEWERSQKRSSFLLIGEERLQAEDWLAIRFQNSQPPCLPTPLHCEFITESRKNAENLMTEVFLAYADVNRTIAEQVRQSLQREGFTVWANLADIQAGGAFQQMVERGIEEADNLVYLLSPAAVQSPWCQYELDYALSLNKRIIPLLVEPIALDQTPLQVRNLQYIDLTDNVQDADYEQDESQLLKVLRQDATYHKTHKRLLTSALKWDRQHRNPTLLLRGYNLKQAATWLKIAQQNPTNPALPLQETFIKESQRQPPGLSLDVFISYSRADSGFARRLNEALQLQGKYTWFDQESIAAGTTDFQQEIHRGIESADVFLFILSPRSVASPYCADEVEYAAKLNKRFVTILHQPIDTDTLHPLLAKVQWLDFNRDTRDFSAHFTELLRILDTDSDHLHAHTRLLMRAIEWDEQGRKESLLLRGDELSKAEQWLSQCQGKEPVPTEVQRSYVKTSRAVEDANQQATKILQAAVQKATRLVWIAVGIGALVAGAASFRIYKAETRIRVADVMLQIATVKEESQSGQQFQALLKALEANQAFRTQFQQNSDEQRNLKLDVMGALQQALDEIHEKNTLTGHQSAVETVSFSPDGQTLASGSDDKTIKLWDVATGQEIRTLTGHQNWVVSVSFSPDGKTLASGSADNTIKLWDVETGNLIRTLSGHQNLVWSVSFSPDSKTIASGSWDNTIKLWDVETGQEIRTFTGHQNVVWSVSFSPDGKTLASGSDDKEIKLWDVTTGKQIRTLTGHQNRIISVSFSPDGQTLASGSDDKTVKLWSVATGKVLQTFVGHQDVVWSVSFSPDGKTLASGSADNTINLWSVETAKLMETIKGHLSWVTDISFSPDGKTIASSSFDNTIKFWNVETAKTINTLAGHEDRVSGISFSPDGKVLASASYDGTIKLWDMETEQVISTLSGHQNAVISVSFSPDGKILASSSKDNTIKLWNVETKEEIHTLTGHQDWVSGVSFSPDGKTLASSSADSTMKLWDVATGSEIRTLTGHKKWVNRVRFSPDGTLLASASDDATVKLWNVDTGSEIRTLTGHKLEVSDVRFSPNGQILASASLDKTIKLWDVATGNQLNTLTGHQIGVWAISFSADGQTLASGSGDNTIKLWNVETGQTINTLTGHQNRVWSVDFSPDGILASGSEDNTIKLWVWNYDRLTAMGCDWIQQYLVDHEDQKYLCDQ